MRISEIVTETQLTELDVRGSVKHLGNRALQHAKDYFLPDKPAESEYKDILPDGTTAYYDNVEYRYEASTKKWINTETERSAWPVAQRALMQKYGFSTTGEPGLALRRRIAAKKTREKKKSLLPGKVFKPDAVAKIATGFQNSLNEYLSTSDMTRYLNNIEFLSKFIDQDYDFNKLAKPMQRYFHSTLGKTPADSKLLTDLYTALFVTPDSAKIKTIISAYKGTSGRTVQIQTLPTDKDTQVKQTIVNSIRGLKFSSASKLPDFVKDLKDKNYKTSDYETLIQTEVTNLVNKSNTLTDIGDMSAFLDTLNVLKPVITPAAYSAKVASLNFNTMFPAINTRDLEMLRQKRNQALSP